MARPYDCAQEPAGCVLAVGPYLLPPRAVLIPLAFQDVPAASPTGSISPAVDLQDGQEVTLTAEGLRPNATFNLQLCEAAPRRNCSGLDGSTAITDGAGALSTTVTVHVAIYGDDGLTDCGTAACNVVLSSLHGEPAVEVPMRFADGVIAPVPRLTIDPPGPYTDGQVVEVRGSGFPPGYDLSGNLGQCPADKDTAVEERCGYALAED